MSGVFLRTFLLLASFSTFALGLKVWAEQEGTVISWKDKSTKETSSFTYKESHALIVGISEYDNWPSLDTVDDDITEVKTALEALGFHVVVRKNLLYKDMETTYKDFIHQYGLDPTNRLLFYFVGHGETLPTSYSTNRDPEDWMGVLLPKDAPAPPNSDAPEEMTQFRRNGHFLPIEQFALWAKELQSRHVLFMFDSCFSGARGFDLSVTPPQQLREITKQTGEPVRQFISAGKADQPVPKRSIFRRQFIAALKGEADYNHDQYVTGSELGRFLQEQVSKYSRNKETPQYGSLLNPLLDKGDFVFPLRQSPQCTVQPPSNLSPVYVNSLKMPLALIPAGGFTMGSDEVADHTNIRPAHKVTISQPFYLGKYEVTQQQWSLIMGTNPSHFTGDPQLPVENVSWTEVQEFIRRLNMREGSNRYRLPTEAEWEYAARACATESSFENESAQSNQYAWLEQNANGHTHVVGQLNSNAWGLYDIQGNVWEWCQDWYGDSPTDAVQDPTGNPQGAFRVYRGGG